MLSWINYVANASMTASSEADGFPVANLKQPPLVTIWRAAGNSATVNVDFGQSLPVDVIGLFGTNYTASATSALRMSNVFQAGTDAFNSPSSAIAMLENYNGVKRSLRILPSTVNARYLRLDLTNVGAANIEAGMLWVGPIFRPIWGRSWGATNSQRSDTNVVVTRGGQAYSYKRPAREVVNFNLDFLTDAEVNNQMKDLQKKASISDPVLAVFEGSGDPSTNFILGRLTAPLTFTRQSLDRQSVKLEIEELG